jgi:TonB family protein
MRVTLTSLTLIMMIGCASPAARAQSGSPAPQNAAAQAPELAEAERLTRTVVQLFSAGKFEQALPDAERVVSLREKALGSDHVAVGKALSNLATILSELGKLDRARDAYERALPILEGKLGADDALTNQTREDLAGVYYKRGDYKKAQALLEATLSSREKTLGVDHDLVAQTLVDLAYVYMTLRDSARRDATFRRLIDRAQKMPESTLKVASKLFNDYACTGAHHPYASDEQKEIEGRIQQLWYARKHAGNASAAGGVLNGRAIEKPQPGYPAGARNERVQGTVVVRVVVDETGKVVEAEPVCGPSALLAASVNAAKHWKFTPTLLSGVPVKVAGTISFNFMLR